MLNLDGEDEDDDYGCEVVVNIYVDVVTNFSIMITTTIIIIILLL